MALTAVRDSPGVSLRACVEAAFTPFDWARVPDARALPPDAEAHRLLQSWERLVEGRGGPGAFERRLALHGLDRAGALAWLAPRALPEGMPLPAWSAVLDEVLQAEEPAPLPETTWRFTREERAGYDLDAGRIPVFPHWLHPFVAAGLGRLTPGAREALDGRRVARDAVARAMLVRLSHLAARALAAEIARRGDADPPTARARAEWLGRVPVLARLLAEATLLCAQAFSELLERAQADRGELARAFEGGDPGGIAALVAWRSDAHHGGRAAAFVTFESGLRVVYKPRSHDIDLAFAAFVREVAAQGAPALRLPAILARPGYGWSEHIASGDCDSPAAVDRYRERQGAIAAIVYFLCGMDFHYENFIACGEWPVPVDLEALFALAPHLPEPQARALPRHLGPAASASVLSSSMATYWRAGRDDQALFTASGIAGCGERLWPQKVPVWEGDAARPRLAWRARRHEFRDNLPRLGGRPCALDAHGVTCVARGFRAAYDAIASQRERLLGPGGAYERFGGCRTRIVLRDTAEYASVLFSSLAPAHLGSGRAYAVAMEALSGEVAQFERLDEADVLAEDRACALAQDVPAWHGEPDSRHLVGPSGRTYGPLAGESALAQARARLALAGEEDREYQAEVLRAALLAALEVDGLPHEAPVPSAATEWSLTGWGPLTALPNAPASGAIEGDASRREALDFARDIGEDLARLAMRLPEGQAWLGLSRVAGNAGQIAPVVAFPWTAAGAAGTAVLFANLHRTTGEAAFASIARSALRLVEATRARLEGDWWPRVAPSAYSGCAFPVYAFAECARLLDDESLFATAREFALALAPARLRAMDNPDWLGGAAGVAAALAHLHLLRPDPRLVERIRAAGEAMVASAGPDAGADGIRVPGFDRALLGMAHGAAGVAAGAAVVAATTGEGATLRLVEGALRYERRMFDASARDWPDLRRDGTPRFMSGWCAGPAGAGLARLVVRAHSEAGSVDGEIEQAIANNRERMGIDRHHACCGEAGRILFLCHAAGALGRPDLREEALRAAGALARFHRAHGYLRFQELTDRAWTPGLLDGAAGVALALLAAVSPGGSDPLSLGVMP